MNRTQEALLDLLCAARSSPSSLTPDTSRNREKSNRTPISPISAEEWPLIIKEADRHGLSPYLFQKLRPRPEAASPILPPPAPAIPETVLSALRRAYMLNSSVNLQRFHYLGIALRALTEAGVAVIVLKGGYLAEAVYGNIAARVMCDIDILVRRDHVASAVEALQSAGFDPEEHCLKPPPDVNEFHFRHRKSRTLLELHWELFSSGYPYELKEEYVWPASIPARIADVDVRALSPEDLICHQAAHAGYHSFNFGLRGLVDCVDIIGRLPVDWKLLVSRARLFRSVRPVWLYLTLAKRLLAADVPDEALSELLPAEQSESIVAAAMERVLPAEGERSTQDSGNPNLILLFGRKGIREKLALGLRRAFPSRASIASLYPVKANSPRVFLYYPKWIWALIRRNAPAIRARIASRPGDDKTNGRAKPAADSAALMDWLIRAE